MSNALNSMSRFFCLPFLLLLTACGEAWNDPYPAWEAEENVLYSAFTERPKHLDPAQSYTEDEFTFIAQIYASPLQYHYLKRPYALIPATVEYVPEPEFYDAKGQRLPANAPAEQVAESVYELKLKPGQRYQPHPAFALDAAGNPLYGTLTRAELADKFVIRDFPLTATRELTAADYIYQLKRLAHPRLHSPIFGMMAEKIVGLKELGAALEAANRQQPDAWLDLDAYPLSGVTQSDAYTWRVRVKGRYPQFVYWLTMPFFAPVPREADRFFSQSGMAEKNLTLDWWPVGNGPYMLTENDPNRRMTLEKNPYFQGETYPCEGEAEDAADGLLADCGKPLPFIDKAVFTREKEAIPYWNKFLQGYYDASGIASDNFDQAVKVDVGGIGLSDEMQARGIGLLTSVRTSIFYMGFNLFDPVVGGNSEQAAKLRRAISIALDQEEFISIFLNGRGIPGMNPLPPGIFGFEEGESGINPYVYDWVAGKPRRKSTAEAKRLLAEAGWPNGRNAQTGEPLVLNLDTTSGGMGDKSRLDWLTRQARKIDVQLVVRATDFNRFQDKINQGAAQIYFLGWNADYPDPENFFFLLSGAESRVKNGGENSSNYANPEFDRLFEKMKRMENTPERLTLIRAMNRILQHDAPWIFAFHPQTYTLTHAWLKNRKPSETANNTLKYQRLDIDARKRARAQWNLPHYTPLLLLLVLLPLLIWPAARHYRRRDQESGVSGRGRVA
ncbi:MAG: ABC transporter substrate-binding protein [Zoogloeaceae bacterium]|jgi:ABC-type transport system substrate-binding protein|nr:ABC transporter substrate-binding protein [Zoogloeaceae bacterium]